MVFDHVWISGGLALDEINTLILFHIGLLKISIVLSIQNIIYINTQRKGPYNVHPYNIYNWIK